MLNGSKYKILDILLINKIMIITKKLALSSIDIDLEKGIIWINTINGCILRIEKLKFDKKFVDKFDYIDIANNNAMIINYPVDSEKNKIFENFIYTLSMKLFEKIEHHENINEFINEIYKKLDS